MKLSYHGHSIVYFETNGKKIIIDPFISGNDNTDLKVDDVQVDYILLTHGHDDHVGDTIELAKKNDATVVALFELAGFLEEKGLKAHPMSIGGKHEFDFGTVKFVHAFHSSSVTDEDGNVHYAGMPAGIIVNDGSKKFYHMGDTGIFGDMKLISDLNGPFDVTFVPIGDNFTMGIDDAAYAINSFINTKCAVPIHYDTFPPIKQNPEVFKDKLDVECKILKPGDTIEC